MDFNKIQINKLIGKKASLLLLLIFSLCIVFIFRNYFFRNQVPFPANLLMAYYQPWKTYGVPGYPSGPPNKPIGFDNLRIFYPLRRISMDEIKSLTVPLWNPYVFSGNTLLGTYQSAIFHPLGFLFLILPQIDAWSLIIIVSPIFCYFFTYLYLQELGLSKTASFFGSVVFSLSLFSIVWWEESFMSYYSCLFLPLALYSVEKIFKKIEWWNFLLLVAALAFSILSGWFQMSMYLYLFVFLYSGLQLFKTKKIGPLVLIAAAFILSALISFIHLLPSFEALKYSPRDTTDVRYLFNEYLLRLPDIARFLVPDLHGSPATYNYFGRGFYYERVMYVGIPALFFILYEMLTVKVSAKEWFYKAVSVVSLSLALYIPTSWFILYSLGLPLVTKVIPSRILYLSMFSFAVLAAYGFEKYLSKVDMKKTLFSLLFIALALLKIHMLAKNSGPLLEIPPQDLSISLRNIYLQFAFLVATSVFILLGSFKKIKTIAVVCIIAVAIAGSFYFANKYLYFSQRQFVFPQNQVFSQLKNAGIGIDRVVSAGDAYVERNMFAYYGLQSPEGYDSIYISRYGELINSMTKNGKYFSSIPRADAKIFVDNKNRFNASIYYSRIAQILGIKYVVEPAKDGLAPTPNFKKVWSDDKFNISSYDSALPRYFLAGDYVVEKNPQAILNRLYDSNFDISKKLVLEESLGKHLDSLPQGKVTLDSYKPNRVLFDVDTEGNKLLFLSDNYFAGWKVYVDGAENKIYRADYSFRAVFVPKGQHKVSFIYDPTSFRVGLWVTIASIGATIAVAILIKKKRYGIFE